ncbi:hypothetical protein C8R43DRAFT_1003627, partial [Mycena crocata]
MTQDRREWREQLASCDAFTTPTARRRMASPQHSVSPSARHTFSDRISAVGAKINRALSSEKRRPSQSPARYDPETESIASTIVEGADRSCSRGRDAGFHSSGRGGAGNVHSTSASEAQVQSQEFPWPRGRERVPAFRPEGEGAQVQTQTQSKPTARSTGRGGSGNFSRSPAPIDQSLSLRADASKSPIVR